MIENCNAIIFDMDGLMIDSEKIVIEAIRCAGEAMGFPFSDALCFHMIGRNSKMVKHALFEAFGQEFPLKEFFLEVRENSTRLTEKNGIAQKAGLKELIYFLEEFKIPKAVGTASSRKSTLEKLSRTHLIQHFEIIVCGDEVEQSKPAPDIYLKAAQQLKRKPTECLVLEDSEPGIQAANAAGMLSLMVPDLHPPSEAILPLIHQIFPTLHEVKDYLAQKLVAPQTISD